MKRTEQKAALDKVIEQGIKDSYEIPNTVLQHVPNPMVSVRTSTFQHVQFIRQCIEGVLGQQTTFPFEFIIGEDFSTDGTREIVLEYAEKFPDRIRVITADRNVGMKANGRRCIQVLRGKYVALCEGDDHWIDPQKLQRQVEALEKSVRATGSFTNAFNECNGVREPYHGGMYSAPARQVVTIEDYLRGQAIPTCTFMYRRSSLLNFDAVGHGFVTGDTAHFTYLLAKGHFLYQPVITGVRVIHPGGTYSMKGVLHRLQVSLHNIKAQDELTGGAYQAILLERKRQNLRRYYYRGLSERNWPLAQLAWSHLRKDRKTMNWSVPRMVLNGFKVHYPNVFLGAKRLLAGIGRDTPPPSR